MKIFYDSEFTGLHQETTLISIGFIAENNRTFYAEFTDYDYKQMNEWLKENVLPSLYLDNNFQFKGGNWTIKGASCEIVDKLRLWLDSFGEEIQIWSDCLSYDWVLLNNLWGDAQSLPDCLNYIPMDICTYMQIKGVDPDISREEFSEMPDNGGESPTKHNALWDAKVIKACYEKICAIS